MAEIMRLFVEKKNAMMFQPLYFRTEITNKKVFIGSSLIGWGIPSVFVSISAGVDITSYQSPPSGGSQT